MVLVLVVVVVVVVVVIVVGVVEVVVLLRLWLPTLPLLVMLLVKGLGDLLLLLLLLLFRGIAAPVLARILIAITPFSYVGILADEVERVHAVNGVDVVFLFRRDENRNHRFGVTRLFDRAIFNFLLSRLQPAYHVPAFFGSMLFVR